MSGSKVLGDRYRVGELLGYGGMAEVRKARDNRLDRDVAVKILRSDLARDHTFQVRFRREAQSAAALNHPAIVSVFDTGTDDSTEPPTPFIVMEYVEGQTLRDLLRSRTTLEPHEAMRIVAEMCAALDFSHRNGIIHRDVKPGNVMITPAGRVKVMDFGIARAVSDTAATMTATAAVIGTAQYLSPEQARGDGADARSDVYAAGCVLYELLTGTPPFVGDSPVAVAYQHVREIPKPPSEIKPGTPRELDAIAMKALSKNPANRYQSAAAMQEDLERALTGQKIIATPLMTEEEATELIHKAPPAPFGLTDDDEAPATARNRKRTGLLVGLGALLVAAIVAAFLIVPTLGDEEPVQVNVPSIAGLSLEDAKARLEAEGLKVGETTTGVSSIDEKDKVIGQNPSSGSQIAKGSEVAIEIGGGPALKTIPDLVGKTQQEVEALLVEEGLIASPIAVDHASAAGTVTNSNPAPGQPVPEGSTVTIFVSSGVIAVPDVTTLDQASAEKTLTDAGFTNIAITEVNGIDPAGTVVNQDPASGKVAVSTTITLEVSTGPVTVPDVVGKSVADATAALTAAGITSVPTTVEQESTQPPGTVIAQDPAAGTAVAKDSAIQLTIARAPAATPTPTPTPTPND